MLGSDLQQFGAQLGVRGEAAANDQGLRTVLLATAHRLLGEHRRDGIGQRRAHVVDGNLIAFRLLLFDPTRHGRLHAGETEIVRMLLPRLALCKALRHFDGMWVAQLRVTVDVRAAGIRETKQTRHLVEAFAGSVVERGADHVDMPRHVFDMQQRSVPARHNQRKRVLGERSELQLRHRDMSDDVVDAVDRLVRGPCQRFRAGHADRETAGEAGSRGYGDRVDVGQRHVRVGQSFGDAWHERFGVRARGDFGNHAAVAGVLVHGGRDHVGNEGASLHHGRRRFVTGRFDAEYDWFAHCCSVVCVAEVCSVSAVALKPTTRGSKSRLMVYASMPSGW